MRKIRLLSLLLVTVLVISSCGIITINRKSAETSGRSGETDGMTEYTYIPLEYETVPDTDGESISRNSLDALDGYDMKGTSVLIAAATECSGMFNAEEGKYASSVALRNSMLADKFAADIVTVIQPASQILKSVANAKKSGDYFADFIVIPAGSMGEYYKNGYLKNLRSLPYLDLDAECFNYDAMSQMTVGNSVYGAVGFANEYVDSYVCLYANKKLLSDAGKEIDYTALYSEEFGWDGLFELFTGLPEGVKTLSSSLTKNDAAIHGFSSSGFNFVDTENGYALIEPDEELDAFAANLKSLVSQITASAKVKKSAENGKETTVTVEGFDLFASGLSAFAVGTLGDMEKLGSCGFEWEVLPFPIYSEGSGYATPVSKNAPIVAVLEKGTDVDRVGHVLAALFAASEGYIRDSFLKDAEKRLITRYTTIDMIDLICENPIYDFAVMFGSASTALSGATTGCVTSLLKSASPFSVLVTEKREAAEKYLDGLR